MARYLTIKQIAELRPCSSYLDDNCARLRTLFAGRTRVTARTALRHPNVPIQDRVWLGIELLPDDSACRLFACDCAERALLRERAAGREPDPRSWAAVDVARRYTRGEASGDELAAARDAAWEAALDAARDAAWDATRDAIHDDATVWDAARVATRDAARDAEREWQITRLLKDLDAVAALARRAAEEEK